MRSTFALLGLASAVVAQQSAYGQCGGIGWSGATTCVSGFVCTSTNQYFSQCVPGSAPAAPAPSASSTVVPAPSTTLTGGSSSASGPGTTLQSGYLWIRAVEAPNFHKYLQTNPQYSTGTAILDSYTTAGQFQIVEGQLVELTAAGLLYANVIHNTTSPGVKLAVTFGTTKNTFGTFSFSGDSVQWSDPSIARPNLSAWLVCEKQSLWINLGNYMYMTPAGCVDETIHYYNADTANN